MEVLDYTPCRSVNAYKTVENDRVVIITFEGMITLQGAGKEVWMHANGKTRIRDIIRILEEKNTGMNKDDCQNGVLKLLKQLQTKGILIANWDPLYKNELPQEI